MKTLSLGAKLIFGAIAILTIMAAGWIVAQYGANALIIIPILVLGLFVIFQTIRNPFWGFLAIIFFLPFERFPTYNVAGVDIRINTILGFITLISWALALLASPKKFKIQPNPLAIPLILFIVALFISLWQGVNFDRAEQVFVFILFTMALGILSLNMTASVKNLHKIIIVLFFSSLLVGLFGLFQFFGDVTGIPVSITLLKDIYTKEIFGFPRIQAFSVEPLYFANFLLIPIGLGVAYFFGKVKLVISRRVLIPLLILLLVNFVLTVSRGAYIGLIVALIFLFVCFFRRLFTWRNILTGILTIFIVGYGVIFALSKGDYVATNEFVGHVLLRDFNVGESIQGRLQTFRSALDMYRTSPVFGVGLGNFGPNVSGKPYTPPPGGWPIVNNQYIETLAETGVVGLSTFILVLLFLIIRSFIAWRKTQDPFLKSTMIGLLAAFIGVLVQYASFSTLYIIHIWVLIGLMVGVGNLILRNNQAPISNNHSNPNFQN